MSDHTGATDQPRRFVSGVSAAMRGMKTAAATPDVRRTYLQLVAILFLVAVALDVLGVWAVLHWIGSDGTSFWATIGIVLLRIAAIAIVLLAAPVIALFLVNLAFPFLGERVFLAGLRTVDPLRADELAAAQGLPFVTAMLDNLMRMLLFLGLSVGTFLVSLIPVAGAFAGPVLQAYFTARALGWELLDPWFDKQRMRFDDQHAFVRSHRAPIVGFGLPFSLMMAIPLIGPLVFGLAQASAGVLVAEVLEAGEDPAASSPAAPGGTRHA